MGRGCVTPEMLAGLLALGPWGVLAGVVIYIARKVEAGRWITREHHGEIVQLLQKELDRALEREKELRGQAVTASAAIARLAAVLTPERRHDDAFRLPPGPELR